MAPGGVGVEGLGETRPDPYEESFDALKAQVTAACAEPDEWPAKVSAGVHAAVAFAVAHPGPAKMLALDFRVAREGQAHDYRRMIRRFSTMLSEVAPEEQSLPASTDEALIASVAAIVGHHLRQGSMALVGEIAPDLVFLILMPRLGLADARRWSASA